jgi:4-amino-4-deoxy-L-arabinose transferase-like glycosyltransferase
MEILNEKRINLIASFLLLLMFVLAVFSMKDDSLTMDELAHLPAGYSYLTQRDMRLNPEHPPLIKDLAAFPLLFIKNINFPKEIDAWQKDVNGQWAFGNNFLFHQNNPALEMIFWARIPMILLLILLGFFIFKAAKEIWGPKTALLSLFFYTFSPTFLAHGRLVTTDVAAAFAFFIGIYFFVKALKNPNSKNIIFSGLSFGIAELLKFSLILLVPFFIFLAFCWWLVKKEKILTILKVVFFTFLIGYLLIWPVYFYHTLNYPTEKQAQDALFLLFSFPIKKAGLIVSKMAEIPILKPYSQYLLGLLMVLERASSGHTTYFMGEVGAAGWKTYFPTVYLLKEPLSFHLLTLIALFFGLSQIFKKFSFKDIFSRLKEWLKNNFETAAMIFFLILYWLSSLTSNLNIGVRHLLPVFPFTMLLVSRQIIKILETSKWQKVFFFLLVFLLSWQIISVLKIYPHFLAYFNELAGGPDKGYLYTVDSNLDWGQDLKRLNNWLLENKIPKIYLDYFGGSDPKYYLGEKFEPWWGTRSPNDLPKGSYLAVSATFLQGGRGKPIPGFNQPTGYYRWLDQYQPIAKIGYSIFIYHIK